jgi:hypothetical protein
MKKLLFPVILFLFPFIVKAQNQPQILKDFEGTISRLNGSLSISEHVNLMQVTIDDENFDMIAIDDQMHVLWKTKLKGYSIGFGKFRDKIMIVAATGYSEYKGISSTYNGYVLDPQSGKVTLQKEIYHGSEQFQETPLAIFNNLGTVFKLLVKQNAVARKTFTTSRTMDNFRVTQDLTIIDYNDQLEPVNTIKPVISNDTFLGFTANNKNETFIGWLKDNGTVSIIKYEAGKKEPVKQLDQVLNIQYGLDQKMGFNNMLLSSSRTNDNVIFLSGLIKGNGNDMQVVTGKFDFGSNTHKITTQGLSKAIFKTIEKSFAAPGKDLPDSNLGYPPNMLLKFASEQDGTLLIGLSAHYVEQTSNAFWQTENSLLICGYDTDLNLKFQQVLPSGYSTPSHTFPTGVYFSKGFLYVVANFKSSLITLKALYGKLDLKTGKWEKMQVLSKEKISNSDYAVGNSISWYPDSFMVPYAEQRGIMKNKMGILLQKNSY